jgi:membrane protein implicated in regulation of membrane protease activity
VEEAVFWIVLAVALAIAEIFTTTLLLIMFSVGAFAAAGAAALGAPLPAQALVFAIVSALTLGVARPAIRRMRRPAVETGDLPFGLEAIEGATAMVLEEVDAEHGLVKIDGEMWSARCLDGAEVYQPGERVRVIRVRGATAIVWREGLPPA